MKKITPILAIAIFAISFASCKKDYKCVCKDAQGNETSTSEYPKVTKKAAEASCTTLNTAAQASGGSCSL